MAKKYQMRAQMLAKYPNAVTLVNGVSVALGGKEVVNIKPANASGPAVERKVRPATQAELQYLFETEKHPFIEEIEDSKG